MFFRVGLTLAWATLSAIPAIGSPVTISTGGTWGTLIDSDAYFVSNEAWTLSIQVESSPVVISGDAEQFATTFSNAVYTLNGVAVAMTGNKVSFFTDATLGSAVPEPSSWMLCGAGLLIAGSTKRISRLQKGRIN